MPSDAKILVPDPVPTQSFTDAAAAVARLRAIHDSGTSFLRERFEAHLRGQPLEGRVRACYPFVRIGTATHARVDSRLSYGFVSGPGSYQTTVARPDLFENYLTEQIGLLIENHNVPVEIGVSDEPIPVHFAYAHDINVETVSLRASMTSLRACSGDI